MESINPLFKLDKRTRIIKFFPLTINYFEPRKYCSIPSSSFHDLNFHILTPAVNGKITWKILNKLETQDHGMVNQWNLWL